MRYTLFLDDERAPSWYLQDVLTVVNVQEAVAIVKEIGLPICLSLDHDLGKGEPTAMALVHWLINEHLDGKLDLRMIEKVIVHSANPVGAENLCGLWDGFAKHIGSNVRAERKPR